MRHRLVVAFVVLALVAAAAWLTRGFGLWREDEPAQLTLYGNVDIRSVDLGFRVGGRIAEMPIDEGARVEEGAVLARLDTRPLVDARNAAEAQVLAAAAELRKRRNGNRPQDIARAEALVAERRAALARTGEERSRRQHLVRTGAVSQAALEASEAQFLAARAQLDAALQALSLQRAGARVEDIDAARAEHAAALARRDKAYTDLADATLQAPAAGVVLTRAREPGAIVQPGETVFTLTLDRPLRIRAYVSEPNLSRISPGMAVEVRADGNPKVYRGTIGFISPAAEFTPKSVQTEDLRTDLVYRLRIIVDDPDDALRQGQPVTVTVPQAHPANADAPAASTGSPPGAGR